MHCGACNDYSPSFSHLLFLLLLVPWTPPPPTPSLFPSLLSSHSMFRTAVHAHPHTHATHSQQHAVQDIVTAPKKLERVIKKLEDEMTEIRKARR